MPDHQSENSEDSDELKQALLAAFGDDAMDMLDDDDDFDEIPEELLAKFGEQSDSDPTTPCPVASAVQDHVQLNDSDSPRVRWIKNLSGAIYASRSGMQNGTLAKKAADPDRLVVFAINDHQFGLPMHCVREIARYPRVTRLPRTPKWLRGLANLRGQIVSIIDLTNLFQIASQPSATAEKILLINGADAANSIAIVVERVLGIHSFDSKSVNQTDPQLPLASIADNLTTIDCEPTFLLKPDRLFEVVETAAFAN